jgi:ubiquinone/menaquinone biosynthesis C-methylase UbiE
MIHAASHTGHHSRDRLIHWARVYDLGNGLLGRRGKRLRTMLADDLELRPGDRVLDVGCGPGRLARVLAERVAPTGSVDGIDAAAEMINRASRANGEYRVASRSPSPKTCRFRMPPSTLSRAPSRYTM